MTFLRLKISLLYRQFDFPWLLLLIYLLIFFIIHFKISEIFELLGQILNPLVQTNIFFLSEFV